MKRLQRVVLLTALAALLSPVGHAALPVTSPGALDPTFGGGSGTVTHSYATYYDYYVKALIQSDGKYVVVGYGSVDKTYGIGFVGRHLTDGSFDASFNGNGRRVFGDIAVEYSIVGAELQPDGKILVVGNDYRISVEKTRGWIARLMPDGSIDASFGAGGSVLFEPASFPYRYLRAAGVLANGSIQLAGYEQNTDGTVFRAFTARLRPDGTLDPSYGNGGISNAIDVAAPNFRPRDMQMTADGRIVLTGTTRLAGNAPPRYEAAIVRLNADGSPDAGFATAGKLALVIPAAQSSEFHDVLVDAKGVVTSVGWSSIAGLQNAFLIRLKANGSPDPAFGPSGILALPASVKTASGLVRMNDGRMIATGISKTNDYHAVVARLLPGGQLDSGFADAGLAHIRVGQDSAASGTPAVDAEGRIILAGRMWDGTSDSSNTLLARVIGTEITTPVVEFYNGPLNHYFVTADPNEAAAIDSGAAGPGWARTGQSFKSGGPNRVCRFYGSPEQDPATGQRRGPNSHFYTIDSGECAAVKTDAGWKFESYDYNGWTLANGACPAGTQPIKRVYNGRWQQNDSNHRYITTDALYQQMTASGWNGEGSVFCAAV